MNYLIALLKSIFIQEKKETLPQLFVVKTYENGRVLAMIDGQCCNVEKRTYDRMKLRHFHVGQVWKMMPTDRSHVQKPYFVEIAQRGTNHIITSIPGHHTMKIELGTAEWDYHIPRMIFFGYDRLKLYNQKCLINGYSHSNT